MKYIAGYPSDVQKILEEVRTTIRKAAPKAEETIKYGMPTFTLNGNLVFFAAYKNHIGFYPIPQGIDAFKKSFPFINREKGSVQFPLDKLHAVSFNSQNCKIQGKGKYGKS